MYRSHNKKIRIEQRGSWYEIFLIAENAQHIVDRASDPSHRVSLQEVMELAQMALYFKRTAFSRPEAHYLAYGLVKFQGKYYQIVGYITELWGKRFVIETCRVVSDEKLRARCERNAELLTVVTRTANGLKSSRSRKKPS